MYMYVKLGVYVALSKLSLCLDSVPGWVKWGQEELLSHWSLGDRHTNGSQHYPREGHTANSSALGMFIVAERVLIQHSRSFIAAVL